MTKVKKGLLERLKKDVVLGAEGYVFELEARGYIKAGPYVPEVVLDYPRAVEELHREFVHAGSEVVEALTYYAHRDKLKVVGREKDLEKMNRQALRLAKKVAKESDALVAGNVCNTWVYDPKNSKSHDEVRAMFREQIGWAKSAGVDFVIAETIDYLGEALIALEEIKKHKLVAMVTFSMCYQKTKDNYSWVDACKELERAGADIVGLNCLRGPETMVPTVKKIRKAVSCYVAAQPVPYRTTRARPVFQRLKLKDGSRAFPIRLEPFVLDRFEMAKFAREAKKIGVNYIGICCGAKPYHVRAMAEALGREVPGSKYSPQIGKHAIFGTKKVVKKHERKFAKQWRQV